MSLSFIYKSVVTFAIFALYSGTHVQDAGALTYFFKNSQVDGNGSDTVEKLKTDIPNILGSILKKNGHRITQFDENKHDVMLQITTNVSISYNILDARVVFEKSVLVFEKDGQEIGSIEYSKPSSAGHFRTYGSEGLEYAQAAASYFAEKISSKVPNLSSSGQKESQLNVVTNSPTQIFIIEPALNRGIKLSVKDTLLPVTGKAVSSIGIAEVKVNNQLASLDENGNFAAEVLLKPGENQITVMAMNLSKHIVTEQFTVKRETVQITKQQIATVPEIAPAPTKSLGKGYALIIGINQYKNIDHLRTATNDALEVAQVLKKNYGFDIKMFLDQNATRTAIMQEINSLKTMTNPEDKLLIYYAGHGYNDPETETSYWLPVDADKNDPTNWIETRSITDHLKRAKARQILIVADSCYSGTMSRTFDPLLSGKGTRDYFLNKLKEKPSRVLIASGGNEPVSDSGGKNHSIFADVFINSLKNPPYTEFTAEELLILQIKESVAGRAEQTPEYKIIRNSGHDGGDFIFNKLN